MDDPTHNRRLQKAFWYMNRLMLLHWYLGLGWMINIWPAVIGQIMVLTHTGRKSGLRRRTPVNYAVVDGELYCTAGFGKTSDWYRNMKANPNIEVWMPDGSWFEGKVEDVTASPEHVRLMRAVMIGSGFAAYVFGLNPHKLSDQELEQVTAPYRLLHIVRGAARTGPGGPGEYAWIWPVIVFLTAPALLRRKRK